MCYSLILRFIFVAILNLYIVSIYLTYPKQPVSTPVAKAQAICPHANVLYYQEAGIFVSRCECGLKASKRHHCIIIQFVLPTSSSENNRKFMLRCHFPSLQVLKLFMVMMIIILI